MGPSKQPPTKQSWQEINTIKKEKKRKWKEQNLAKKVQKQKCIEESTTRKEIPAKRGTSTVSIAVPGSILENAQSAELRTYLAGQIARAATIFQIDEIVVYDDFGDAANEKKATLEDNYGVKTVRECCVQLGRILQYLECPQYLRKHFFPIHKDLQYSGLLNPLNAPHHLQKNDKFTFREGVVLNKPTKAGQGSIVNIGLLNEVRVDKTLTPGIRCTVKLCPGEKNSKKLKGNIVSPSTPRSETGIYWGYNIRLASSISQVFSQSPFSGGYDLTVGTSDKGTCVDSFECPPFRHLLIMFGGVHGLEAAVENDDLLNVDDPRLLFDHYLNTLPCQGSKTIRTEEAILISLSALRAKLNPEVKPILLEEHVRQFDAKTPTQINDDLSRFD